jgi:hypothetical protein
MTFMHHLELFYLARHSMQQDRQNRRCHPEILRWLNLNPDELGLQELMNSIKATFAAQP